MKIFCAASLPWQNMPGHLLRTLFQTSVFLFLCPMPIALTWLPFSYPSFSFMSYRDVASFLVFLRGVPLWTASSLSLSVSGIILFFAEVMEKNFSLCHCQMLIQSSEAISLTRTLSLIFFPSVKLSYVHLYKRVTVLFSLMFQTELLYKVVQIWLGLICV